MLEKLVRKKEVHSLGLAFALCTSPAYAQSGAATLPYEHLMPKELPAGSFQLPYAEQQNSSYAQSQGQYIPGTGTQSSSGCADGCIIGGALLAGISALVLGGLIMKDYETRDRENLAEVAFQEDKKPTGWILSALGLAGGVGLMAYGFSNKNSESSSPSPPSYMPVPPARQSYQNRGSPLREPIHCDEALNVIGEEISSTFRSYKAERDALYFGEGEKVEYSRINEVSLPTNVTNDTISLWVKSPRARSVRYLKLTIKDGYDHYLHGDWSESQVERIGAAFRVLRQCADSPTNPFLEEKAKTVPQSAQQPY